MSLATPAYPQRPCLGGGSTRPLRGVPSPHPLLDWAANLGGAVNPRARPSDEGVLEARMRSQPGPLFWLAFSPARPGGWAGVASQAVCLDLDDGFNCVWCCTRPQLRSLPRFNPGMTNGLQFSLDQCSPANAEAGRPHLIDSSIDRKSVV